MIVTVLLLFYHKFLLISFQSELARLRGIRVGAYHTLLLVLTQVVGLVMVIALITLPGVR